MSKFFKSMFLLLTAGLFTATGWANSLIARWDNFTGLTAENSLSPSQSATVNGLNGGSWRFNLGGGSVTDGVLDTGTGSAPNITFDKASIAVGKNGSEKVTVLVAVQLPYIAKNQKSILHIGNGTTGYGLTATSDKNQFEAAWGNRRWGSTPKKTINEMAADLGTVYLLFTVAKDNTNHAAVATVTIKSTDLSWQQFDGLHGNDVNASKIVFGNFVGETAGGLNYKLKSVAVFNGAFAPLEDVKDVIRAWEGVMVTDVATEILDATSWSTASWVPSPPVNDASNVTLTVSGKRTLTMNESASVIRLTVDDVADGENALTIARTDSNKLTATTTTINADTTVNAGAASLGTVTIAADKTLTVKENWANVAKNVPTTTTNRGKIRFEGGSAETPIVFSMGSTKDANPGALVMAPGSVVKLTATGGNKVYNITGETGGDKANVLLYSGQNWGMTNGSVVSNVKLIVPSTDNCDFWLRPGITDATVDLELQGRKLTGDTGSGTIVLGDFVTNAEVVANGKSLSVQTGRISGTAGFDSAIAVDNSGEGTFTVALTYGAALTINENGCVTVAEGGSLTGTVTVTGKLTYAADATPTNTITNNGTIAADGENVVVNLTGATLSGSGTYAVKNVATLILPAGKEGTMEVPAGATLALVLSPEQLAFEYVSHATGTGTIVFKKEVDGTLVDVTAEDGTTTENGTFTPNLNTWEGDTETDGVYAWSNDNNWSKGKVPAAGDRVVVALGDGIGTPTLTENTTVVELSITGKGSLKLAGFTLTANRIKGESQETTALTLEGTGTVKLNASSTFERKTLENLSLTVPSDVTLATELLIGSDNPIFADVAITFDDGASWKSHGWLQLDGTVTVANAGNLELAMLNTAQPSLSGSGKLKKRGAGTLTVNGMGGTHANPLEIEAGTLNLTTGTGSTATFTGGISGDGALKIGSGTVDLTQANTYTGGTEIAEGATLKLTATSAQTLSGNISGAGKLVIGDGTAASSVTLNGTLGTVTGEGDSAQASCSLALEVASGSTLTLNNTVPTTLSKALAGGGAVNIGTGTKAAVTLAAKGNNAALTVAANATLNVETGAPPETIEEDTPKSIADGKTVTNNGTLTLTSGYGYFNVAGTGKTVVPGSDFLFGIGSANGDNPFSNGLEVPASANFRIRPWNHAWTIIATGTASVNGSITKEGGHDYAAVTLQIAAGTTLSGSSTFSIPVTFANDASATMASDATFTFSSALTVPTNVTLPGTVTLATGATLSGTGKLSGTFTCQSGATVEAGPTLSGSVVTFADGAKLLAKLTYSPNPATVVRYTLQCASTPTFGGTVKISTPGYDLSVIKAPGLELSKFVVDEMSEKKDIQLRLVEDALMTFCKPVITGTPDNMTDEEEEILSERITNQFLEVMAQYGVVGSPTSASADPAKPNAKVEGALLFEHVVNAAYVEDAPVALVSYDFGVSDITVKSANLSDDPKAAAQLYVLVCAKVSNGKPAITAAGYANDTTVSLWLEGKVCDGTAGNGPKATELTNEQLTGLGLTRGTGEKWFAVPMAGLDVGTHKFTVKATK